MSYSDQQNPDPTGSGSVAVTIGADPPVIRVRPQELEAAALQHSGLLLSYSGGALQPQLLIHPQPLVFLLPFSFPFL